MKTGVTLAMIVRNEAEKLSRCLESAQAAVDEVVIVDTGSEDRTLAVAESIGAKANQIAWPNDFSIARNASLDLVETEWVLWLDADEWLADGAAMLIRAAIHSETACGFLLTRYDLFPNGGHSEQQLLRLWRNHPSVRFEGVVHEHLDLVRLQAAHSAKDLEVLPAGFWHDGYTPEILPEKAKRNLPLLEAELRRDPASLYIELEIIATLKALGESGATDRAEALAESLLAQRDQDRPPDNTAALFFMRYLSDLPEERLKEPRTDLLLRLARGWHPDHPGVLFIVAQAELRRGNLREALRDLLEVERMAETGEYDRLTSTNPVMLGTGLSTNLALVAHQLGRREIARKHYERLLSLDPENPLARQNMAVL